MNQTFLSDTMLKGEMGRLSGKVAIVTGGASGIGKAISHLFAEEGAEVIIADINKPEGQRAEEEIRKAHGRATFVQVDVSRIASVKRFVRSIGGTKKIDILVNNAGLVVQGSVLDLSEKNWDKVIRVNLKSVFLCTKFIAPLMLRAKGGSIVNIASEVALAALPNRAGYAASKGGVIALTRSMAVDLAPDIRVNAVCPGLTWTPLIEKSLKASGVNRHSFVKGIKSRYPLQRGAEPREIAQSVLFLASDESSFVTASVLVIDGGRTAI